MSSITSGCVFASVSQGKYVLFSVFESMLAMVFVDLKQISSSKPLVNMGVSGFSTHICVLWIFCCCCLFNLNLL